MNEWINKKIDLVKEKFLGKMLPYLYHESSKFIQLQLLNIWINLFKLLYSIYWIQNTNLFIKYMFIYIFLQPKCTFKII